MPYPPDLAADDIAEQFPALALEFPELKLLDRSEVSCACVDRDAGQEPFQLQTLDEQVADDALRFMLALDGGGHDLVEGGLHAVELELGHKVEELSSFHQMVRHKAHAAVFPPVHNSGGHFGTGFCDGRLLRLPWRSPLAHRPARHPLHAADRSAGNHLEFASLKDAALHEEQHHIAHCQYADANSDHEKKELVHAVTFWAKAPERRSVPLGNRKKAPRPNVTQADKFRAKF